MKTTDKSGIPNAGASGAFTALMAALLFGISTPMAKLLLGEISPLMLAGLLYLGCGLGLIIVSAINNERQSTPHESELRKSDSPILFASILCGGILAPIMLLYGLSRTSGTVASLLLNSETILTAITASLVFREPVGWRVILACITMLIGSLILHYQGGAEGWAIDYGASFVILACLMWAIDNNLTRKISHRNPFVIAKYKGFIAGATSLVIAFLLGHVLPSGRSLAVAMLVGAIGYGGSLVFFIYALRNIGTSRTVVYFSAAPFIGAMLSIRILHEAITPQIIMAFPFMCIGIWLIIKETHEHEHEHMTCEHEHSHTHDEHHAHEHDEAFTEPHCHDHCHNVMTHSHSHVPDIHHFHNH